MSEPRPRIPERSTPKNHEGGKARRGKARRTRTRSLRRAGGDRKTALTHDLLGEEIGDEERPTALGCLGMIGFGDERSVERPRSVVTSEVDAAEQEGIVIDALPEEARAIEAQALAQPFELTGKQKCAGGVG